MTLAEFKASLLEEFTAIDTELDVPFMTLKISNACDEVKRRRNYKASGYSDKQIEADIQEYASNIRNVALYDYNQAGAEFESAHGEIGINRSYTDRERLFVGVAPFVG